MEAGKNAPSEIVFNRFDIIQHFGINGLQQEKSAVGDMGKPAQVLIYLKIAMRSQCTCSLQIFGFLASCTPVSADSTFFMMPST